MNIPILSSLISKKKENEVPILPTSINNKSTNTNTNTNTNNIFNMIVNLNNKPNYTDKQIKLMEEGKLNSHIIIKYS